MTDRELLELAAKAAGVDARRLAHAWPDRFDDEQWNPLTDDGDEARLEAALQLNVEWHPLTQSVQVGTAAIACSENYRKDAQAARRRAGVRAAAEIGRTMK